MMIGNIFDFWSSVRERRLASTFKTSLALRPTVAVSEGVGTGSCNPASPANATEPAIKISNENIHFISFSKCRSRCMNNDQSGPRLTGGRPWRRDRRSRGQRDYRSIWKQSRARGANSHSIPLLAQHQQYWLLRYVAGGAPSWHRICHRIREEVRFPVTKRKGLWGFVMRSSVRSRKCYPIDVCCGHR